MWWEDDEKIPLLRRLDDGSHRPLDTKSDHRINPWHRGTIALPAYFFVINIVTSLYSIPFDYYLYDVLDVSADTQYLYEIFLKLPECLEIVFALWVISTPYTFRRAKFFWGAGIVIFSVNYILLATRDTLTANIFMVLGFASKCGERLSGAVVTMELMRRTKLEPLHQKGYLVVTCALASEVALFIGLVLDEIFYANAFDWQIPTLSISSMALVCGITPLITFLPLYFYDEPQSDPKSILETLIELFSALASPDVLVPVLGYIMFQVIDVSNKSTKEVLIDGCGVSINRYIAYEIFEKALMVLSVSVYRRYIFQWNFVSVMIIGVVFYQLMGLNELWLAYNGGENVLYQDAGNCLIFYGTLNTAGAFVSKWKDECVSIIFYVVNAGRPGRTTTLNVLFTSINEVFSLLSSAVSDELLTIWPTSAAAIEGGNLNGWVKLQLTVILSTIFFKIMALSTMPASRTQQADRAEMNHTDDPPKMYSGHWKVAFVIIGVWVLCGSFDFWWSFRTDKSGSILTLTNSTDVFIFVTLVAVYSMSAVLAVILGSGMADWLHLPPRKKF